MMKTKIKKVLGSIALVAIATTTLGSTYAATQIGTGSVTGTGAFDSAIMWDDNFPGTASGSVSGIKVIARILPTLTMEISTGTIDLWDLTANVTSSGSLFLEIGTNAKSGVSVTARSSSGWLVNTSDSTIINDDTQAGFQDGIAESYTFASTPNATNDSSYSSFTASWLSTTEVNENTTEHVIYNTNKPESANSVDDVEFVVSATATNETSAWYYEDTITFTVTGNF